VFGLCFLGFSIYDLGLCYGLDVFKGKYFLGFLKVWGLGLKGFFCVVLGLGFTDFEDLGCIILGFVGFLNGF